MTFKMEPIPVRYYHNSRFQNTFLEFFFLCCLWYVRTLVFNLNWSLMTLYFQISLMSIFSLKIKLVADLIKNTIMIIFASISSLRIYEISMTFVVRS